MALGYLGILFGVLALAALIAQFLLYKTTNNNGIFIFNVVIGITLSFLIFTSLPTNYTTQKYLSLIWGALAVLAIIIKSINIKNLKVSKVMLTVSLFGGLIHLFN